MLICVSVAGSGTIHGFTTYDILPIESDGKTISTEQADYTRIQTLCPRIEAMSRRVLGKNFRSLELLGNSVLELRVKQGTSKGLKTKDAFRDLVGWISLMDDEPHAAT